jgi:hypothetical protein
MTQAKETWAELGDRLEALGLKLKLHLEQGSDGAFPEAMAKLGESVKGAFEAAGNAVKDDAVKADVRDVGQLLGDLLSNALAKVKPR